MKLSTVVYQFFSTYLPHIKGVSNATIKTYRDAFTTVFTLCGKLLPH